MVKHLACIMDGNRRWAKKYGWLPWDGHKEGVKTAQRVINFCLDQNIPYLSLYTFSLENFNRPKDEQHFLFSVLLQQLKNRVIKDMIAQGVRVTFVGDRSRFPQQVLPVVEEIETASQAGTNLQVNLLFCYGGRQEIMQGIRVAVAQVRAGAIALESLDETVFENLLWSGGTPAPDIIIRTGGVQRLSNFLLFQAAYSELYFLDCFWPELSNEKLHEVIDSFKERQRNFGA